MRLQLPEGMPRAALKLVATMQTHQPCNHEFINSRGCWDFTNCSDGCALFNKHTALKYMKQEGITYDIK